MMAHSMPNQPTAQRLHTTWASRALSALIALALAFPAGLIAPSVALAAQTTTRVSVSSTGSQGNDESTKPYVSANGRYVVFASKATNLVSPALSGTTQHIYWHDRETGATELVSVSTGGVKAASYCSNPSVSDDGRYVAFESHASNLVAGDTDDYIDVFVRDRVAKTTVRASVASGSPGAQANSHSENPVISANGRYVAFDSAATNLVTDDGNKWKDVFLRDLQTNTTTRVSMGNGNPGQQPDGHSSHPAISADGRYVAFQSKASNLVSVAGNAYQQIYVRDRTANTTTRCSVSGTTPGNSDSQEPVISGNGLVVAFETFATNLGGANPAAAMDVIVWAGGSASRVNRSSSGALGNDASLRPSLSHDGRYVAYDSAATNLVGGDTNGKDDVFVRDRTASETTLVSVSSAGAQGNGFSTHPSISGDGLTVAYDSQATNLVGGDTNGKDDVFVSRAARVPTGTIKINGGAAATNSAAVTVNHTVDWKGVSGPGQMRHTVDGGATWVGGGDGWVIYSPTRALALPAGDGAKTVRVEFMDGEGSVSVESIAASIILDTTKPTGSISLNGGATSTASTAVTLGSAMNFAVAGPPATEAMRVSVDGGATWSAWGSYAASKPLALG
ncbi:MAG: calcium-binding protein [Coriobacteriia bacterium]|jgi:Tol biopolymer transport system component|nr:calcium-binding protein [Coriobacteriia bacterium]